MPEISNLSLTGIAILALVMLWRWQRSHPEFDLSDLITGDNGKVSATKFAQTGAWVVATWGFVTLVQQGRMSEWYLAAYMGFSFGTRVAKDAMAKPVLPQS
jgi:hypothetical protein